MRSALFVLGTLLSFGWSGLIGVSNIDSNSVLNVCCEYGMDALLPSELFGCILQTNDLRGGEYEFSLLTYTTSDIVEYSAYSIGINSAYAEYAQYSMKVLTPTDGAAYEPKDERWNKVKILLDAMSDNDAPAWTVGAKSKNTRYVVWMDADLVVLDFSFRLEEIVAKYPDADLLLSSDPYPDEIFSIVNTGFIIAKVSDRSRAFLSEWWGSTGQRQQGWDQHAFTKLYLDGHHVVEGGGAYKDIVQLLAPDAVNTHRPATVHQKPHNPVLHMIGSVLRHRQLVFSTGLHALCSATGNNSTNSGSGDMHLPSQLGLTREKLQDIEEIVLGRRGELAMGLLRDLQTLSSSRQHEHQHGSQGQGSSTGASFFDALLVLKGRLDEVMKLGDPRAGEWEVDVQDIRSCLRTLLDLSLGVLQHHQNQNQEEGRGQSREGLSAETVLMTPAQLVSVLEWGIDAGFELALGRPAEQVHALMSTIEPLTSHLVELLAPHPQSGEQKEGGPGMATAYYFQFKRLQFSALAWMDSVSAPDDGSKAAEKALLAMKEALRAWTSLSAVKAPLAASRVEEGARVKESLGLLLCGRRDHLEGMLLQEEALSMLWSVWGRPHAPHSSLSLPSNQEALALMPKEARTGLTRSYFNLAACEAERAGAGAGAGAGTGDGDGTGATSLQLYSSALAHVEQAKAILSSVQPQRSRRTTTGKDRDVRRHTRTRTRRQTRNQEGSGELDSGSPSKDEDEDEDEDEDVDVQEDEAVNEYDQMWAELERQSQVLQSKVAGDNNPGLPRSGGAQRRARANKKGKRKMRRKRRAEEL